MRNIRISDEVWGAIAARGKFGETEDDVLRREFGISPALELNGSNQQIQPQFATKRMTARVEEALKGKQLYVGFVSGEEKCWDLPEQNDHSAIRRVRSDAVEWVRNQGASKGQEDAVKKALTDAGYYLRR